MLKKMNKESQASPHASYVIAYEIANRGQLFTEGEFFKDLMLTVANIVCPDKEGAIQNISIAEWQ